MGAASAMHSAATAPNVVFMLVSPACCGYFLRGCALGHDVAPLLAPVVADQVHHLAAVLEELVGHLEHGDHQSAFRRPRRMAAARGAVDEFAGPHFEALLRSFD